MSNRISYLGKIALALVATSAAACASAPTAQETAMLEAAEPNQIVPASRAERDAAAQQDLLSQAAFWGKEYTKNPNDYEASLKLAQVLRLIGSTSRASEIASQALNLRPEDIELTLVFAQASLDTGKAEAAVSPLARIEASASNDWRVMSIIGVTFDQLGRHKNAQSYYEKALALSPDNPKVLSNLGLSYALQGDVSRAEHTLRIAAKSPAADARIHQNLAVVLGVQGKFDEVESAIGDDAPESLTRDATDYFRGLLTPARNWDQLRGR